MRGTVYVVFSAGMERRVMELNVSTAEEFKAEARRHHEVKDISTVEFGPIGQRWSIFSRSE